MSSNEEILEELKRQQMELLLMMRTRDFEDKLLRKIKELQQEHPMPIAQLEEQGPSKP
tara:strand:+ start:1002 stop:1175 length:174 start_codon:yes stop_codon:yes gene_type:complete